jgi:hypothetical protein
MKRLLLLFLVLNSLFSYGQSWDWAKEAAPIGLSGGDLYLDHPITIDKWGNAYITGLFNDTLSFGTFIVGTNKYTSVFLVKYDTSGNVIWAEQGTPPSRYSVGIGNSIAVDAFGNTYITGDFADTISFGIDTLKCNSGFLGDDVFIAKFDPNGNVLWAKQANIASSKSSGEGYSIATDLLGNAYITGIFADTVSFGFDTLRCILGDSIFPGIDVFVAKFDSNGNVLWAKQGNPANKNCSGYGGSIAVDAFNNVYITGSYSDTLSFGAFTLTSPGIYNNVFLTKYDANGNVLWAKQANNSNDALGTSVAIEASGDIYYRRV